MNRSNLVRGAIALTIPCLVLACTRSSEERAEEERREAEKAQVEANTERREAEKAQIEANAERRHELEEARTDPKIQANEPESDRQGSNQPSDREPSTNAADAVKGLAASSVRLITEARCHREEKCGNIGPNEKYASISICQQKIGADWQQELNSYDCPGGVVVKELNECLAEIKNEDCSSPFDTLGRIVACRSSDICKAAK